MERSQADWTLTWRQLAVVAEAAPAALAALGMAGKLSSQRGSRCSADLLNFFGGAEDPRLAMVWRCLELMPRIVGQRLVKDASSC